MKLNVIAPSRLFDEKDQEMDDVIIDSKQSEKSKSKNMNKSKEDCAHYTPSTLARLFFPSISEVSNFQPFNFLLYFRKVFSRISYNEVLFKVLRFDWIYFN